MNKKKFFKIISAVFILIFFAVCYFEIDKYSKRIIITQFAPQTDRQQMGYMIKTNKNKVIMIDGGSTGDAFHIKNVLKKNGGVVDYWFITHAHDDHFGALLNILQDENSEIKINNLVISFNDEKWYKENDGTRYEDFLIKDILNEVQKNVINTVIHLAEKGESFEIDNLNFKILKIASPEIIENAGNNQSMVVKVENGYKSVLFLGDLSVEAEEEFIRENEKEMNCDVVQMAHHGQAGVSENFYEIVDPDICLWPTPEWLWNNDLGEGYNTAPYKTIETRGWIDIIKVKKNYIAKDGDQTIEIY